MMAPATSKNLVGVGGLSFIRRVVKSNLIDFGGSKQATSMCPRERK